MARLRRYFNIQLIALLALAWAGPALAQDAPAQALAGLYDRPVLVLDPGMHTAPIGRIGVDAAGRFLVTGSLDKTVRVWSLADGRLLRTLRVPVGEGNVGKVSAVAITPDGSRVAAGGWGPRRYESDHSFYLFERATGRLVDRVDGLPDVIGHLAFSPDGRHLVATLGGANGIRVFETTGFTQVAEDRDYGADSYEAAFDAAGRLATTSDDGQVRLYDAQFRLIHSQKAPGGEYPFGIALSPDGRRIAVGYDDSTRVDVLDGRTLAPLFAAETTGVNGSLHIVAWSTDGQFLYAGGRYVDETGRYAVRRWAEGGRGPYRDIALAGDTIMDLRPLADGRFAFGAQDPTLGLLGADGTIRWRQDPAQADFRDQEDQLALAADGTAVVFGFEYGGKSPARFDLAARRLTLDPAPDPALALARTEAPDLVVEDWFNEHDPKLNGKPLPLARYEISRSLALAPDGERFLLGTEWWLRLFDRTGKQLWQVPVPGIAWSVNVSGDGRLALAAFADGTIRWYRLADGRELLAFFPLADKMNWVAWTPEGFYAATPGAHGVLRWHVNHGLDAAGEAIPVSDIAELRRPEVLPLVLQQMDIVQALGLAELNEARLATQRRLNSAVKPGTQLHVLAVGVGDYNAEKAKHLRLEFADDDAWDVASALLNTQGSLYAKVNPQVLRDGEATRAGISRALDSIQKTMLPDDVAVFHFSGHGAVIGDALYLLPYEVDARDPAGIEGSAIEIGALRKKLVQLAERGRVLVLLDACRSGAITEDGTDATVDASQLRAALAAANVTVVTSSSGKENSIEHRNWQNGAFTQVFLEALGQEADSDRNSVVSMTELTRFVTAGVPRLVHEVNPERQQTPGIEMRFEHTIFAAGL